MLAPPIVVDSFIPNGTIIRRPSFEPLMLSTTVLMCRQTFVVVFCVSFILIITDLLGRPTRRPPPRLDLTQSTRAIHEDPFKPPYLTGCNSENVIPGKFWVILKHGYSLEQHTETIGTNTSSSIYSVTPAFEKSRLGVLYGATLNNATLAAVLNDFGVKLVECDRSIKIELADLRRGFGSFSAGW